LTAAGRGLPRGHRRAHDEFQQRRAAGLLRRPGPRPERFRPRHRQPTPTRAPQPKATPGFYMAALSSLKCQGPSRIFYDRKRSERLLHAQAPARPGPPPRRRALGATTRRPNHHHHRTATSSSNGLTRSLRFSALSCAQPGVTVPDTASGLPAALAHRPDPRARRGVRHRLPVVVSAAVCAVVGRLPLIHRDRRVDRRRPGPDRWISILTAGHPKR
jgi:hypothetical protein